LLDAGVVKVEVRLLKKRSSPDHSFHVLGKYLSLALTLPASVFAGYLLGAAADHWLHVPFLRAVGILLGMVTGIYQIVHELSRDERRSNRPK
jgi:F0F1-type ATP synthase assembly protein I